MHGGSRTRWHHSDQFTAAQFQITTKDNLIETTISKIHICQPDEHPLWMRPHALNMAHHRSGDADDHRGSIEFYWLEDAKRVCPLRNVICGS